MSSRGLYLHWEGKKLYRQRVPNPRLLEPVTKLSLGKNSGNLVVEGDNLQAIASLKNRYAGEVDVIYIDPPYNTGKNDFLYSDKRFADPDADHAEAVYVTNEDGGRHTKWLNFMAPRLYMLWTLLKESGVLFVSINDIELFHLGMLLNEIFGEENWIGTLVWKGATDNNPTRIATEHEYILCYARDKNNLPSQWVSRESEAKALLLDAFRRFKAETSNLSELQKRMLAFAKEQRDAVGDLYRYRRVDMQGPYAARRNLDNPGKPGHRYEISHPRTKKACRMPTWGWRFAPDKMKELISEGRILFGKDETKIPELKVYLEEVEFPLRSVIYLDARAGSNELERLFGKRDVFKNPKPVPLIAQILSYACGKDGLILDAFAGSGTTGHAVLSLNAQDGGSRRFILIEDQSARLAADRLKRAIKVDGYGDGFTFYTTGRKLDRAAIVGLERDALANLICQADETGRGNGITRLTGYKYLIGKNHRAEAICLVWYGNDNSEVTRTHLQAAAEEVTAAKLKRPFRIYGTFCRLADSRTWKFCQIPDDILVQMHIEEMEGESVNVSA